MYIESSRVTSVNVFVISTSFITDGSSVSYSEQWLGFLFGGYEVNAQKSLFAFYISVNYLFDFSHSLICSVISQVNCYVLWEIEKSFWKNALHMVALLWVFSYWKEPNLRLTFWSLPGVIRELIECDRIHHYCTTQTTFKQKPNTHHMNISNSTSK